MDLASHFEDAGLDWLLPEWDVAPDVRGFATTRNGGISSGERATLDLGPAHLGALDASPRSAILRNRRRVERFLPSPPVWLEQVHGCVVASIDAQSLDEARATPPRADGAVTRLANTPLAVRVADCLPVLLADEAGGVVAIAHAGWRGLAAGVLERTLQAMQVPPASVSAWIGPGIGPAAFEVGADVRDAFCDADPVSATHFKARGETRWLADLPGLAMRRLRMAGVRRISGGTRCSYSEGERFFSYRRDRTPARQAAFVWLASSG